MQIRRIAIFILLAGIISSILLWLLDGPPTMAQGSFIKHTLAENVNSARSVTAADLNGDGWIDIIAASPDEGSFQGQITWWENDKNGGFTKHSIDNDFYGAWTVDTADFNGDGLIDVVGATFWGSSPDKKLNWWKNNGNGIFTKQTVHDNPGNAFWSVHAADLDKDGDADFLTADYDRNQISWWKNDNHGQFVYGDLIVNEFNNVSSVYAADLNGDGFKDVIGTADDTGNEIAWWTNNGNGTFSTKQSIDNTFFSAYSSSAADLDNDSKLDVVGGAYNIGVAWWKNQGNGTFAAREAIEQNFGGTTSVHTADIDGDGQIDIVGAATLDNKISWWKNNGNGTFSTEQTIDNGFQAYSVYTADLDNDGDTDVIGAASNGNITWWENTGGSPPTTYSISGQVTDSNGSPLAGVTISDDASHSTTTGSDGNYTLSGLTAGEYTITASKSGYNFSPPSITVNLPQDANSDHDFLGTIQASTYTISGHVKDNNGNPLSDVTISSGTGQTTTTDGNGNYTLGGVPAGSHTITASKNGYNFSPSSQSVTVPPDATGVNFVGTFLGYSIAGRVLDTNNNSIEDVTISDGAGHIATTDANGNYTLEQLPAGIYTLSASKDDYDFSPPSQTLSVPPNAPSGVDFVGMFQGYSISGLVADTYFKPVPVVTLSNGAGDEVTIYNYNYAFTGFPAGTYEITPSRPGYSFSPESLPVTVPPNAEEQNFTAFPPFGSTPNSFVEIDFESIYEKGQPVTGRVRVWNFSSSSHTYTISLSSTSSTNGSTFSESTNVTIDGPDMEIVPFDLGPLDEGMYDFLALVFNDQAEVIASDFWSFKVLDRTDISETDKPLIILIHGCCGGGPDTFGDVPRWLAEDGYPVYVIDAPEYGKVQFWRAYDTSPYVDYYPIPSNFERLLPTDEPIRISAENLSFLITDAKWLANKGSSDEKVILIGHSKGGLVSRVYLESSGLDNLNRSDVSQVIMMGTPNKGSPFGYAVIHTVEGREMLPDMEYFNNKYSTRGENVDYHLIAGDVEPLVLVPPFYFPTKIQVGNDTVVAVDSVHGISGERVYKYTRKNAFHWGGYMKREIYDNCIKIMIKGATPALCTDVAQADQITTTASGQLVQSKYIAGQIDPGQKLIETVQIDSVDNSGFYLLWAEEDLSFTLTDPMGAKITPVSAENDPNVLFGTTTISDFITATASYVLTNTLPGLWSLDITANNANNQTVSFVALVQVTSDLDITMSINKPNYAPGEDVIITATLTDDNGGFPGAILTATIQRPDAISHTLTLYDDGAHDDGSGGDGVYGNTFNQTIVSGYYIVGVNATGSRNNVPFERSDQTLFTVDSANASLSGEYLDLPQDIDGDGLFDRLAITVGIDASVGGDYSVAVTLEDEAGEVIANQVVHTTLVTGTRYVPVVFDGQIIREHGVDGPYKVTVVRLFDETDISLEADEAFDVWTTALYDHARFEAVSQIYLPIILKNHVLPTPDLIIDRITATANNVEVVIKNIGDAPVTDAFWVDVYIDPSTAPTGVNQIWPDLANQGLVWGVDTTIPPNGATIILRLNDAHYFPQWSNFSTLPEGTPVYVQVDSVNFDTTYGAILETHEATGGSYNNIASTVSTAGSAAVISPLTDTGQQPISADRLPSRQ